MLDGALVWAGTMVAFGNNPDTSLGVSIDDFGGLLFQAGLFALVALQLRTRATGTSTVAVGRLEVERVLLTLATAWTVSHGAVPACQDDVWLAVLDVFWPLSMLGMAIIGVRIAVPAAGPGRALPAGGGGELGSGRHPGVRDPRAGRVADLVGAGHLLVGYCTLGLIPAPRPELTGAWDRAPSFPGPPAPWS